MNRNYTSLTNLLLLACIIFASTFAFKVTPQLLTKEQRSSWTEFTASVSDEFSDWSSDLSAGLSRISESVNLKEVFTPSSSEVNAAPALFATNVRLNKTVTNTGGGQLFYADPGQELLYNLEYENISGGPLSGVSIADILPTGLEFVSASPAPSSNNNGNLTFNLGNLGANASGTISIRVRVSADPAIFRDGCANAISNTATVTSNGLTEDSYNSATATTQEPSVFYVNPDELNYTRTEAICAGNATLTAAPGFDTYIWTRNGAQVGAGQTLNVTSAGTFTVEKTVNDCNGQQFTYFETINVIDALTITNPIINYADDIDTNPNNGDRIPSILLCGTETSRALFSGFADSAESITWTQAGVGVVSTTDTFVVSQEGSYTLRIVFDGGCQDTYEFNVYNGQLNASTSYSSYSTSSLGSITIDAGGIGPEYTYTVTDQTNNTFTYGPTKENTHTFESLTDGVYDVLVTSDSGCSFTDTITIPDNNDIIFEVTLETDRGNNVTCDRVQVQIRRNLLNQNGQTPFQFAVWSFNGVPLYDSLAEVPFESLPANQTTIYEFDYIGEGTYQFITRDKNGKYALSNALAVELDPLYEFYLDTTDVLCYGEENGVVEFQFTNQTTGNNNREREIIATLFQLNEDGTRTQLGASNQSGVFPNLAAGDYQMEVEIFIKNNTSCTFTRNFTINQPDAPLEAFAGVITDASCIQGEQGSIVKISNPTGGTPPYQFEFPSTGLTSDNEGIMYNDGTVAVVDANGCRFEMPVDVNAADEIPVITPDLTYTCDGLGTVTLNATLSDSSLIYEYEYSMNGQLPVTDNVFPDLAPGNYSFRVYYENTTPDNPTPGILFENSFGTGSNTSLLDVNGDYTYQPQDAGQQLSPGQYVVTSNLQSGGSLISPVDPSGGRYLAINANSIQGSAAVIYDRMIEDIAGGADLTIDLSTINLLPSSSSACDPEVILEVLDVTGTQVDQVSLGAIANDQAWHRNTVTLNTAGNNQLQFRIKYGNSCTDPASNALAFDNLRIYQTPEICTAFVEVAVVVQDNQAFAGSIISTQDVTCFGGNDGTITFDLINYDINASYQYSVDNGVTWNDITLDPALTGPQPVTVGIGLTSGSYEIMVRNIDDPTCDFTIDQIVDIVQPQPVESTADVTSGALCDGSSAVIEVTPTGGTPPYSVTLVNSAGASIGPRTGSGTVNFVNVAPGDYDVQVTDANGCVNQDTETITITQPEQLDVSVVAENCYNGSDNRIRVTVNNPEDRNYEFSLDGVNFVSPDPATPNEYVFDQNIDQLSYTVYVRDALNCTYEETLTLNPALTLTATGGVLPSCGGSVNINASANGGDGNYVFAVVPSGTTPADTDYNASNSTFSATAAGFYDVYVRDRNGTPVFCETMTTVEVTQDPALTFGLDPVNIDCNGGNNGSIRVINLTGGTPPYTYSINGGASQTSDVFNNLSAGYHEVTVTDSEGCSITEGITLTEPDALTIGLAETVAYDCSNNGATIQATAGGGSGAYEFSLNGGAWVTNGTATYDFTDVTDGTHVIRVRDAAANTCSEQASIIVAPLPAEPTLTPTVSYDCTGGGIITVDPADASYTYTLYDNSGGVIATQPGNNVFTAQAAGTYNVEVTYGPNCTTSAPVVINAGQNATASVTAITNVSCNGLSDGSLTFGVSNFAVTSGYQYRVNGGAWIASTNTSETINGLSAGPVSIDVQFDITGTCVITLNENIVEPTPVSVTATATDMTCSNGEVSTITAVATGGSGSYEYSIDGGSTYQTTNTFDITGAINAGTYTIEVRDVNGCVATTDVTIVPNEAVAFTLSPVICATPSNAGEISVAITAGNGNYVVSIDGGPFVSPNVDATNHTFTNVGDGPHTITVRDAYGCEDTQNVTLSSQISANATITKELDCSTSPDGQITVNINGGLADFSYQVSVDGAPYGASTNVGVGNTSFTYSYTNPAATTTYQFQITDSAGCITETGVITVEPITNPFATATVEPISCASNDDGVIIINVDNTVGSAPYEISFEGGLFTAQTVYTGLAAGTYNYTVRDSNGCTYDGNATIDPVDPIVLGLSANPVTCGPSGNILGSVDATISSGGTAPFNYYLYDSTNTLINQINNSSNTTENFPGLDYGFYYVQVEDANGCESTIGSVNVLAAPFLSLNAIVAAPDCPTGGSAQITASNGSSDYSFEIYGSGIGPDIEVAGPGPNEETATFNNLTPGVTYTFRATDNSNGCTSYVEVAIPPLTTMSITGTTTDVTCNTNGNGVLNFEVTDYDSFTTQLNYEVVNRYTLTPVVGTGTYIGNLPADASNITSGTINDIPPGDYTLIITENDGTQCSAVFDFRITEPTAVGIDLLSQTNANCNIGAQVVVRGRGGTAPYTYAFVQDGVAPVAGDYTPSASAVLDPAININWDVWVMDTNGCTESLDVTIAADPDVTISLLTPPDQCANGSYTFEVAGTGLGTLEYSIGTGFQTSGTFTVNTPGTYTVTVRDENGCTDTVDVEIFEPLRLDTVLIEGLDCEVGDEDAEFSFEISGGTSATLSNMTYSIDGPAGYTDIIGASFSTNPEIITNANVAGDYLITVVDGFTNCQVTATVNVPTLVQPAANVIAHTDVTCFGADDGTISVSAVDNGIGPFTFAITSASDGSVTSPIAPATAGGYNAEFTNLAGSLTGITYTITVTSTTNNCFTTVQETILEPEELTGISAVVTEFACTAGNSENAARIVVTGVTGGTGSGTYTYEFINDATSTTVQRGPGNELIWSDTNGGSFTINVTDENGCPVSTNATIAPFVELQDVALLPTNPSCNNNDGSIEVNVTLNPATASAQLTYELFLTSDLTTSIADFTGSANTTETFGALAAGDYVVRVTNDITNCYIEQAVSLSAPDPFGVEAQVTQQVACVGDNALLDIVVTDYTGTYDWVIYEAGTTNIVDSGDNTNSSGIAVAAGDYDLEVTQTAFPLCVETDSFTIEEPATPLQANVRYEDPTCEQGGFIEIFDVTGGWGGYEYYIGTAATPTYTANPRLDNPLTATTYYVWVRDAEGCEFDLGTVTLTEPLPPAIVGTSVPDSCDPTNGFDLTIELDPLQLGLPPYTVMVDNLEYNNVPLDASGTSITISGLTPGDHDIQVIDANGCTDAVATPITITPFEFDLTPVSGITCAADGVIEISNLTGSGNYYYVIEYEDGTRADAGNMPSTGIIWPNADQPGVYNVEVSDLTLGCSVNYDVEIPVIPDPLLEIISVTDQTCDTGADGEIIVRATQGTPPFTFEITSASDGSVTTPIPADAGSSGNTATFSGLPGSTAGITYTVTVTDANNCPVTIDATINAPAPIVVPTPVVTPFGCDPGSNAANYARVTVDPSLITGGSTSFVRYVFTYGTITQDSSNPEFIFTDLAGGTVDVAVYDSNGCLGTTSATVAPFNAISNPVIQSLSTATCDTGESIQVSVTVTDPLNVQLEYTLTDTAGNPANDFFGNPVAPIVSSNTTETFSNIPVGAYFVNIRNIDTGCEVSEGFTVQEPNTFVLTALQTDPACFGEANGTVTLTMIDTFQGDGDQAGAFTYEITNMDDGTVYGPYTSSGAVELVPDTFPAGNYEVTATINGLNCEVTAPPFSITQPLTPLTATIEEVANVTCTNDKGEIYVDAEGSYPYYNIDLYFNGVLYQSVTNVDGYVFTGLSEGIYTAVISDQEGCAFTTVEETLVRPEFITADFGSEPATCNGAFTGQAFVTNVLGGAGEGSYWYTLMDAGQNPISETVQDPLFTDLAAGTYYIEISDAWSCDYIAGPIVVAEPPAIVITTTDQPNVVCFGTTDGYYEFNITGGTAPFTAALYHPDSDTPVDSLSGLGLAETATFWDLEGDVDYRIVVTDANTCTNEITFMIPTGPDLSAAVNVVYECSTNLPENYIEVTLTNSAMDISEVLYALNTDDINQAVLFDEIIDGRGIVRNVPAGAGQYVTIFHEGCSQIMPAEEYFEIIDYQPLELSLSNEQLNVIDFNATGGQPPYTYYVNGEYRGDDADYRIRETGTYEVVVVDANGCENRASIFVEFYDIEIPNFFTPDGDSNNDVWGPGNSEAYPSIKTRVYDRYGRVVGEMRVGEFWDGTYNGAPLPTGDYWYVIKFDEEEDARDFVGHFTLYR
ncbi:T9SS type B sorting domain-containing protein [Robertkochia marina]|uniref:T9SS type B sorting domain-containing protein n=1 Tax=Robertkochia marina TaxID=1227945 RepID=A0A4S3M2P1_9FLAO|nr:T9SS type B sorting domain-containing protein [Robertkochia marina]THD69323.1 T9SS type B sorting domain-containing protein [Robertkochia marina]